jgi:hypothetical protein
MSGVLATIARPTYATSTALLPSRAELPTLLNRRGLVGRGVEVGVKLGFYSDLLLSEWRGEHLTSVDPWLSDDPERYVDSSNVDQEEQDAYYRVTVDRLKRFGARSSIWRTTSIEAAARISDASLDFVYIDARHDYGSVLEDLNAWFPKVRPGGVIAGHDYLDGRLDEGLYGVKSAVDEFFGRRRLHVYATYQDVPWVSWVVDVPNGASSRRPSVLERAGRSAVLLTRRVVGTTRRVIHASVPTS